MQLELPRRFARKPRRGESRRERRIFPRMPIIGLDAVDDASKPIRTGAQNPLEPSSELRPLNLTGIARADRREPLRTNKPSFEKVEPPVELERVDVKKGVGKAETRQELPWKDPLIGKVMDRQHDRRPRRPAVESLIDREKRRLPVVHVNHVRGEPKRFGRRESRPREKREAEGVVVVVTAAVSVNGAAVEVVVAFDEIGRNTIEASAGETRDPPDTIHLDLELKRRSKRAGPARCRSQSPRSAEQSRKPCAQGALEP